MTMDPRIEESLTKFARTQCMPPGYTINNGPDPRYFSDAFIYEPWFVSQGDWRASAASRDEAITAAWRRSDRRSSVPSGYAIMTPPRTEDGFRAVLGDPPGANILVWQSKTCATIEDANEAAWDHCEGRPYAGIGPSPTPPPSKCSPGDCVRWDPNRNGKYMYGILIRQRGPREVHATDWEVSTDYYKRDDGVYAHRSVADVIVSNSALEAMAPDAWAEAIGRSYSARPQVERISFDRYLGGDGSGEQSVPNDCRWNIDGELVCTRAPHSPNFPLRIGRSTGGGIYFVSPAEVLRVDLDVLRYFLDHMPGK